MALSKVQVENCKVDQPTEPKSNTKKRRLRRQRLHAALADQTEPSTAESLTVYNSNIVLTNTTVTEDVLQLKFICSQDTAQQDNSNRGNKVEHNTDMSSKDKPREDVMAAREAKKLAKQKAKNKDAEPNVAVDATVKKADSVKDGEKQSQKVQSNKKDNVPVAKPEPKSKDEIDKAVVKEDSIQATQKSKEQVLAERAAKKAAKQTKKSEAGDVTANPDLTMKDVVTTLKEIKDVAKDVQDITAKVSAIHFEAQKQDDSGKSKAELKAERRAKQEAQRAAKQAAAEQKTVKPEPAKKTEAVKAEVVKEKSPKPKTDKKAKSVDANRVNWFQHLYMEHDKEALKKVAVNSNLHPAIIKLGVQLASRVVAGSNARCIALLDALKKMVRDYSLPAKTEFSRGFEPHLSASLDFLWAMRQPSASQTNAVKCFRYHLNQLPNNIDEFDAKKILQEEIDKYIEDQIEKAGEAISMAVRNKISDGDNILTYGCSSLVERIFRDAWSAGVRFRAVVVGAGRGGGGAMLRRLAAIGLPVAYVDITGLSFVMSSVSLVVLGAGALLANGCVVGAAGGGAAALLARAHNVPVLVACETHKVSGRVQTDAFVSNEIGDPDALIDRTDENSPLKDWRSNPNLTPLNLTYDVTPASLVTAVVTEKAILPCTSAPVVLRTKLSEYGI